ERFFPMAVEPYLERCRILPSGPQGMVGLLSNLNDPLVTQIGNLRSGEYYLRFVNDPLIRSRVWFWWGVLSVAALGLGWFEAGWLGVGGVLTLALSAALLIFIRVSPIRARIFPAIFAVLFFVMLEAAP